MNKRMHLSNLKFKAIFLSVLLVLGLIVQFTNLLPLSNFTNLGVKSAEAWYDFSYGYKKALMLDNAQVIGGSTLTDFPVLFSFTDSSLRTTTYGGRVRNASGYDIVFTEQGSSTKLDHQIESYDQTTGAITMWVKVPNLYACCTTQIDMYYGNPNISTSQENINGVWSNGYVGVWHLGANLNDSTSNGNNGTNVGATTGVAGMVGTGISTNGSSGRVTAANTSSLKPSNLTVSMWLKRSGAQDTWGKPLWFGQNSASPYGPYGIQFNNASDTEIGGQIASDSTSYPLYATGNSLADNTWTFVASTYNGSAFGIYFNTSAYSTSPGVTLGNYDATNGLGIGGRYDGNTSQAFLGSIDEVRISNTARTAGWLNTEYNTVYNQGLGTGKFIYAAGGEETPPPPAFAYPQSSAIDNTSALVGAGIVSYISSPTVTARWGTTNGACSSLPNTVSATGSNRTDVNNYISYSARITGLPSGQTVYWCLQGTTSNGTGYLTTQQLTTQATAATGCDLLPSSTLASSGDKTTLAGYLGTSKLKGTLLYKATTNGWTATNFHTASNNQGETITLIRNSANSKVFGAYYPQAWTSAGSYRTGSTGFLFNLTDGYQLKQFMSVYQSYDNASYGPTFGGGHDIAFPNTTLNSAGSVQYTNVHSYEYPSSKGAFSYLHGGTTNQYFVPNEIEVYKIDTCTTSAPILSLPTNTSPTYTTVTLGATVDSDGGAAISERGVCYALTATDSSPGFTTPTGSTPEAGVTCQSASAVSPFTTPITGLTPNRGYTYRGYARNTVGNGYSSTGTFSTPNNGPTSVSTSAESGLASYKVTLNGSANPNGSQAYGYFRYFTSAPDCTVDSGGTRMPSSSAADLPLGSGSSPVAFNYTTPPTVLLVPNTNYWYCAYSRNTAAGAGAPGTPAAAGYDTFTTPDGGASGCDAPASGDITITESCTFPQSDNDGVDSGGSGATNTARIILNSGGNITILPGQRIARGSLQTNGGSFSIGNGGGSVIRGGVWIKDSDGDGVIDSPVVKTVSNTQPAGYVRRNHLYTQPTYNNSTFNYASKMYNAETNAPTYLDCDQTNANIWRNVPALRPDTDADGYADTPAAGNQYCVGGQLTNVNGSGRTYYRGATGSPAYVLASQALNATGRQDCDINTAKPCPPAAGLSASAVAGGTQMTVNYTASSSSGPAASSHVVKYMSGSQNASTLLASGSTTGSFTSGSNIGSLSPSTLYSFGLLASNTSGSATLLSSAFQQTTAAACVTAYPDNDQDSYGSSGVIGRGVLSKTSTNGQTSITVTKPADVVNGQLLIAGVGYSGSVTSSGISITAPAGWNLIQNSNSGGNVEGVAMYWKIASGEPVNYTWSFIRISNSTAHATDANAWVIAYDNVNTSNPINASGVNSGNHGQTSSSANDTASAITTTAANTMVIGAMHSDRGQTTFDPVSGMNTTMNVSPGSGYAATISFDAVQASIGSTGTKSSLHTFGGGWAAVMVALNPRSTTSQCVALPSAGWSANQSDCEDNTTSYYQNLNGYLDADGDGVASSGQVSICSGGSLRPGVPSSPGSDCDTNNGAKWQNLTGYIDTDNDNYSPSTSQQICSGSALPSGYKSSVSGTNDCYDLNSSARPGQTLWYTTTRGGGNDSAGNTGNSYDYNCVNGAEPINTAYICNSATVIHAAPGCAPDPECPPLCWDACCGCTPYCQYIPDTVYCTSVSGSAATCGGAYSTNSYSGSQQDSSSCGGSGANMNTWDYSSALQCH